MQKDNNLLVDQLIEHLTPVIDSAVKNALVPIESRLKNIESSLVQVDKRFDVVDKRLDRLEKSVEKLDQRMDQLSNRMDSLEESMLDLRKETDKLNASQVRVEYYYERWGDAWTFHDDLIDKVGLKVRNIENKLGINPF